MTTLDPDQKALFDLARDALGPPRGAEARILAQVSAAAGVSLATLCASPSAASQPAVTVLGKLGGLASQLWSGAHALPIAIVAAGGTAIGVWAHVNTPPPPPVAAKVQAVAKTRVATKVQTAAKAPSAPVIAQPFAPTREPEAVMSAPPTASVVPSASVRVRSSAPAIAETTVTETSGAGTTNVRTAPSASAAFEAASPDVAAEIALIREMQTAWRAGRDAPLAQAIAEHRARFPRGMLSEEREALSAMLACRQNPSRATEVSARFALRYARSPYQARVSSACSNDPGEQK